MMLAVIWSNKSGGTVVGSAFPIGRAAEVMGWAQGYLEFWMSSTDLA